MGVPLLTFPPLWRESLAGVEAAALFRSSVWRGGGVPDGEGRPVLLIPGFMAGDSSLATMTRWLRENGYRTRRAGIRANVGCSEEYLQRLEQRLGDLAARSGQRVAIIGQSRGGIFARVLATRRPDLVCGVVTLGAPTVNQLRAHPLVLAQVFLVGTLGTGRIPGMFRVSCLRGACCERFREDVTGAFPPEVGFTALYSRTDGVVDWRACLDPAAEQIEVRASHLGMGLNAEVYAEVGNALGRFGDEGAFLGPEPLGRQAEPVDRHRHKRPSRPRDASRWDRQLDGPACREAAADLGHAEIDAAPTCAPDAVDADARIRSGSPAGPRSHRGDEASAADLTRRRSRSA